jgi:RNA polymerase sigma-70 factor (ECF subfamily)
MGVEPLSLTRRLTAGDESAFAELFDRFGVRLFRTARRLLGDEHAAEDAVQEVFVGLARSHASLGTVVDWTAYLFASLRHAAGRIGDRLSRRPETLAIDPADGRAVPHGDASLEQALAKLPDEQREVLALKFEGGLTFDQIGVQLGISANTAASRYRYALDKLRRMMEADR